MNSWSWEVRERPSQVLTINLMKANLSESGSNSPSESEGEDDQRRCEATNKGKSPRRVSIGTQR